MSGHKRGKKKKRKGSRNNPGMSSSQPVSEARPGEVQKGHKSLKSALTVVDPGRSLAQRSET